MSSIPITFFLTIALNLLALKYNFFLFLKNAIKYCNFLFKIFVKYPSRKLYLLKLIFNFKTEKDD